MDYSRQHDLYDPGVHDTTQVHVIGCGALGSWVAVQLAKLGVSNITLWDDDVVEEHNLPNQLFSIDNIGINKASALAIRIHAMTGIFVKVREDRCTERAVLNGAVFCCVDSMATRKAMFNTFMTSRNSKLFIEGRMGLAMGLVYTCKPDGDTDWYRGTLYSDDVTEESACGTSQSVGATAAHIASLMVFQYIRYATGKGKTSKQVMVDLLYGVYNELEA